MSGGEKADRERQRTGQHFQLLPKVLAQTNLTSKLFKMKREGNLLPLAKLDEKGFCDDSKDTTSGEEAAGGNVGRNNDIFSPIINLWWKLTQPLIGDGGGGGDDPNNNEETDNNIDESSMSSSSMMKHRASILDDFQLSLIGLLTEENHYNLFAMDESPILLTDNLGPRQGMYTSELVREVEEFGGKQCYNGLRLAQLATLGYTIDVLVGAFAASTGETRDLAFAGMPKMIHDDKSGLQQQLGHSRCDGCFFFDEKHEDILEDIVKDERMRPAKAAILWE